jgi:dihydrofolate reductase
LSITLIACTDINNGIGDADGNLLFKIDKDMKRFVSITSGKHVVMGRKTWESLPHKPLRNRKNYVLTMDESFEAEGATVIHSIDEVIELSKGREVFIIGGGEIYYQTIDIADKLMMTHVHVIDGKARVFFPDYNLKQWKITKVEQHEKSEQYDFSYTFANYERKQD